jgi:uncharacterized protein (DUF58 family)
MKFFTSPSPSLKYRNRSIRLTSEGVLFLFLTLLVGITAINTGNNLLYLLMALMLTLIMISGILSEWCLKRIEIEHKLPPRIFAHEAVNCRWLVRNTKSFLPSFAINVMALYPGQAEQQGISITRILAGATSHLSASLAFHQRGIFHSSGYKLSTAFPFGFFEKSVSHSSSGELVVYPRLHRLWIVQGGSLLTGDGREVGKKGQGPALYNLRDYQHGDNPRDIHWKTSARQAKLFVKEHEKDDEPRVHIWLSNQLPPRSSSEAVSDFEEAVSLAASLVYAYAQKGYEVGLSTFDRDIPSRQGMNHCYGILKHLASIKPVFSESTPNTAYQLMGRLFMRPHQVILVLPWEDPFWKTKRNYFTKIITPGNWRQLQGQEEIR